MHGRRDRFNESHFKILRMCQGKFDCLVFEMLYTKKFKPYLNAQTDSIRAKLFVSIIFSYSSFCGFAVRSLNYGRLRDAYYSRHESNWLQSEFIKREINETKREQRNYAKTKVLKARVQINGN